MQRPRVRLTIGSMMVGMAIVGMLSWIITGLMQEGIAWISHPPLYLVFAAPFLFAASLTVAVTFVQFCCERRLAREDRIVGSTTHSRLPAMRPSRVRFTIRSLMIAVVVVAGLLMLPVVWGVIGLALSLPGLAVLGAHWLVFRGHRHLVAVFFWVLASLINVLYAAACICPDVYLLGLLFIG